MANGEQAVETKKQKYGNDFMVRMGRKGGQKKGVLKGFAYMKKYHPDKFEQLINKKRKASNEQTL